MLKVSEDDFVPAREADIQALLPIHAYSQKQLSSVAVRVDELRRFIVAPIRHVPDVRSTTTHTMEGGEKAFKLRKEKYGF